MSMFSTRSQYQWVRGLTHERRDTTAVQSHARLYQVLPGAAVAADGWIPLQIGFRLGGAVNAVLRAARREIG
jgi:hypothetical protein